MLNSSNISVSVCISVYNGEEHIHKCINSILKQTLHNIEIILVNNGSVDDTLKLMKSYESKYPEKVKVFDQNDKGLALGRQRGIEQAQGEYIAFLDVDDFLYPNALKCMYNVALKCQVDIVECKSLKGEKAIGSSFRGIHDSKKILCDYFSEGKIPSMLWLRLYSRHLFKKQVMPNIYVNNEDIFAFPCLLHAAKNIAFMDEVLHIYNIDNHNSVMNQISNRRSSEKKILENRVKTLKVIDHVIDFIGQNTIKVKYEKEFEAFSARTILNFCLKPYNTIKRDEIISLSKEVTRLEPSDFRATFGRLKHFNKLIQFSVNLFGFHLTVIFYQYFKKLSLLK